MQVLCLFWMINISSGISGINNFIADLMAKKVMIMPTNTYIDSSEG
jgi:hypothetical protein